MWSTMSKLKELRDQLNQVDQKQKLAAEAFATKVDQLEKRIADLERRLKNANQL
jgi:polyhydroxyalkanoate synthesis regulator phasin